MIADLANIPTGAWLVLLGSPCSSPWVWAVATVIVIAVGSVLLWLLLELLLWLRCRKDLRRRQQEQDAKEARWEARWEAEAKLVGFWLARRREEAEQ